MDDIDKEHFPTTEHEAIKRAHAREIGDRVEGIEGVYQRVNKEIGFDFTCGDLQELLLNQLKQQDRHAFKVNLGFGFILFHIHILQQQHFNAF